MPAYRQDPNVESDPTFEEYDPTGAPGDPRPPAYVASLIRVIEASIEWWPEDHPDRGEVAAYYQSLIDELTEFGTSIGIQSL